MNAYVDSKPQAQMLSAMRPGSAGRILNISSQSGSDVERGLLEMGFIEGAQVEILHHGLVQRDPLAVRINQAMTVALRRCEAHAVLVEPALETLTLGHAAPGLA